LGENQAFEPGNFNPFMELAVEKDDSLIFAIYKTDKPLSLTVDQWDQISTRAKAYRDEISASGEEW
jgi:hypothetical protein